MADETVWKFNIQDANSIAVLEKLDTVLLSAKDRFDQVAAQSSKAANNFNTTSNAVSSLASKTTSASENFDKLSTFQVKAAESAKRLEVAQAQAALALKKADETANSGKASTEQIALAQTKAALAAEKVNVAENAAGVAMGKVQAEAQRLGTTVTEDTEKTNLFSRALSGIKEHIGSVSTESETATGRLHSMGSEIGLVIFSIQQIIQVGGQAVGTFVELGKKAGDFQQGITQLATGAGELDKNLGMVSAGILKLAPEVGTSTKELESGMYMIESAGQHGAKALQTLHDAAEGARLQNVALTDVAKGVTIEMNDYAASNLSSAQATNTLVAAVGLGQTHIDELSQAFATVLPTSAAVGVSLTDTSAAMATMTSEGTPAADAATYLKQTLLALTAPGTKAVSTLREIGLSSKDVSDEMKVSLPGALQLITDHLKQKFPEGSAAYVEALKNIVGGSKEMQGILELTGEHLQTFKDDVAGITDAVNKGGGSITGWNKVQQDFNFQMDRAKEGVEVLGIKLGTNLFPVVTQLFAWISSSALPALNSFSDWFFQKAIPGIQGFIARLQPAATWLESFVGHGQAAIPVLAGIGGILASLVVPVVWSLASGVIAATWPFVLLGVAVAGATAIFLHFYNTNSTFHLFVDIIAKKVIDATNAIYQWVNSGHAIRDIMTQLQPIIAYLAPLFLQLGMALLHLATTVGPLLAHFGEWLVKSGTLQGIITGIVVGIGLFVQGLTGLINGLTAVITFFSTSGSNAKWLWDILASIGGFLVSTFKPVWDQLVATFQTQLLPAFSQLWQAIQVGMPLFQALGAAVVVIVGLMISVIGGIIGAIGMALPYVIQAFGGIVQIISGALQVIIGIVSFFADLFAGRWSKLGADLGVIWSGIVSIASGLWNAISGIFLAGGALVVGFVVGFVTTIIGFFTHLWEMLVGHSIIPDMINGIVDWFGQLPGRVGAFLLQFVANSISILVNFATSACNQAVSLVDGFFNRISQIKDKVSQALNSAKDAALGVLGNLVSGAFDAGSNVVKQIAAGINGAIQWVKDAIGNVTQWVKDHLPHSPAKIGPLKDLQLQGSLIPAQIAEGMQRGMPSLSHAIDQITAPIAANLSVQGTPSFASSSSGNGQAIAYLAQMVVLLAQIVQLQQQNKGSNTTNNTLNANPMDAQRLNQVVQAISGWNYEGIARGGL